MSLKTIVNLDNLKVAGEILGMYGTAIAAGLTLVCVANKVCDWADDKKEKKAESKKEDELRTCNMEPSATNEDSNDYEVDFRFFNTY